METDKKSRYAKTPLTVVTEPDASQSELRQLRLIPRVEAVFTAHPTQGDRLDLLAAKYYRDPLLFWKICDASDHLDPFDAVTPGQPLPIPPNK